jgi:hypothetical protein
LIVVLWSNCLLLQICQMQLYTYESSIVDGVALRCISLFFYSKLSTLLLLSYPTKDCHILISMNVLSVHDRDDYQEGESLKM